MSSTNTLSRTLQRRHLALITLGGVIGAGLFVGSSASISAVGPAVVLSYLVAGLIVYSVMAMIGELAAKSPGIQAFTDLVRAASGPGMGFVIGWLYWYLWIVVMAIEAVGGATLLRGWIPLPIWLLSGLLIVTMMAINLLPTRSFGEFEFWFSAIKVAAILAFIAVAGAYCFGSGGARSQAWINLMARPNFIPNGVGSVLTGVVTVFFSLTGAELTTIAAVEAREQPGSNSRLAAALIARIILFYIGSVLLIVCLVPWDSIAAGTSPFTVALKVIGLKHADTLMAVVILTAVLSCLNSAFYISSRVLFSLAAYCDAPVSLVRLNSHRVPVRSVLLGAVSASLCLLAAILAPGTAFAFLVNASGCLILFIYIAVCIAHLAQCSNGRWVTYLTLGAMLVLLVAMGLQPHLSSQLYVSSTTLVVAICAYLWLHKRRQR